MRMRVLVGVPPCTAKEKQEFVKELEEHRRLEEVRESELPRDRVEEVLE